MITIATGIIQDEDSIGLVGCHAYGVLEIVECEGHRLMLVKNPWGHFRWKGKFAYGDANWTPSLKKALGYDNFSKDKGVFWINFESVMQWFSDMSHTGTLSIKDNPQYFINFSGTQNSSIGQIIAWVAITKLLVIHKDGSIEDEEKSSDYMAMHVFNNPNKGSKVLEDKNCLQRSIYSPEQTIMLYL